MRVLITIEGSTPDSINPDLISSWNEESPLEILTNIPGHNDNMVMVRIGMTAIIVDLGHLRRAVYKLTE